MDIFLKWLVTPFMEFKTCIQESCYVEPFSAFFTPLFVMITATAIVIFWRLQDSFMDGDGGRKNRPPFARV